MDQKELADLLQRSKAGTASEEELIKLETFWLHARRNKQFLEDHSPAELEEIEQLMYRRIKVAIRENTPAVGRVEWNYRLLYRVAAVLFVLISVSVWYSRYEDGMKEIRTEFGQRLTVSLPDKSTVVLNGNSLLRYSESWNENCTREVWMEGEGFFSVIHTENHQKFIVHANELMVEVLGTKFNVKVRPFVSEVMLEEGQVKLGLSQNAEVPSVFLRPGEVATMSNQRLSKRSAKKKQFTSWVDSKLFFERTPLREIAQMLKETYGLQVRFENPTLENRELSGEISSATADDILYAITETFNLKSEKEGSSVIISDK